MAALDDIAFLTSSPNRVAALEALTAGPHERSDLQDAIDVSRSTVKRTLNGFRERGWVDRDGQEYSITPLGELVAERFTTLLETIDAGAKLREVVQWLPTEAPKFDIELFADATVTTANPGAPYRPINRLMRLIEGTETETVRSFGTRPPPGYFDALDWRVSEGLTVEVLFSPVVVEAFLESPPEDAVASIDNERLSFRVCEGLPCGLTLLDEHVAICGYDPNTGMLQALIDTDDPAAVEWGESTYNSYRHESRSIDPIEFAV